MTNKEPTTEDGGLRALAANHQMPDSARPNVTLGEIRAALASEARATAPAGLDRWLHTSDGHPSALDIAAILEALGTTRRLRGLWVQYHGDGTGRARRKGDVVVSCQWDRGWGIAHATDATDGSVRDASRALAARLRDPGRPRR